MELPSAIAPNGNLEALESSDHPSFQLNARLTVDSDSYVLGVALDSIFCCSSFAVSLSSKSIKLFSVQHQSCLRELRGHDSTITKLKFSKEHAYLLYSSSLDGTVKMWDMRTKAALVQQFVDESSNQRKPITTFDLNSEESYLCGGTELIREDAFLLFWDRRTTKILGGYWNSHTDDITEVIFHPHTRNILASGSVDGLINVYNLNQPSEDDALMNTLNTDSSVGKIMWKIKIPGRSEDDLISCITHTEELQLWNINDVNPQVVLDRTFLKKRSGIGIDYLVGTFEDRGLLYIVTGCHNGDAQIWEFHDTNTFVRAQLNCGHKDDVRAISWNPMNQMIVTGGEDGIVCIWKKVIVPVKEKYKMESHMKKLSLKHSSSPY